MRWLKAGALIAGLTAIAVAAAPSELHAAGDPSHTTDSRADVHVIFVESPMDVARMGELEELCQYVQRCGYANACYYDAMRHGNSSWIVNRVCCIRRENPAARVMLVGWSSGTNSSLDALRTLGRKGVCVDTVVHVDSSILNFTNGGRRPRNAKRVVCIYRTINRPENIPCNALYLVDERWHLRMPQNRRAVSALMTEIRSLSRTTSP